jgi:DNA mismatch repair protein MutL
MPSSNVSFSPERARIRLLDDAVVSGIAAGEVIERPASVVKELVENALDAGAQSIEVRYDDADRLDISVSDDGRGIVREDLDLAVTRHATSKLGRLSDLSEVRTFGFRGEALASIAAVAGLEVVSRTGDANSAFGVRLLDGRIVDRFDAPGRVGTRVRLSDLFGAVPARKKFLKSAGAEFAATTDVLRRFSLLHPDRHFRLLRERSIALDLPPVTHLVARLRQVLDADVAVAMHALEGRHGEMEIHGAVSAAGVSLGAARRMFLFVNGRTVQDKKLFRAVMEAYRTYLLRGRYPAVALFLSLPGPAVDVNVHPAKLEVRFADPEAVQRFVIEAIRETLRGKASPLGRWGLTEQDLAASQFEHRRRESAAALSRSLPRSSAEAPTSGVEEAPAGYQSSALEAPVAPGPDVELALGNAAKAPLTIIGQVLAGYIVCEQAGEVVLVDQHAAHERVLYERLLATYLEGRIASQPLLVPITVAVGGEGADAVERERGELERLGWEVERFGDADVVVRAVPAIGASRDLPALVERLATELAESEVATAGGALAREVLATVACHAATRVGQRLDTRAARALVEELGTVDFAASCPHGRPVARRLDRGRIERLFGR